MTGPEASIDEPPSETLRDAVRERILAAHRETGGNLSETARRLGVSRNTVYRAIGGAAGRPGLRPGPAGA